MNPKHIAEALGIDVDQIIAMNMADPHKKAKNDFTVLLEKFKPVRDVFGRSVGQLVHYSWADDRHAMDEHRDPFPRGAVWDHVRQIGLDLSDVTTPFIAHLAGEWDRFSAEYKRENIAKGAVDEDGRPLRPDGSLVFDARHCWDLGMGAMLVAHDQFSIYAKCPSDARLLEFVWDGINDWRS